MASKIPKWLLVLSGGGALVGAVTLFKGGDVFQSEEKILGRTVIITGANTGLGKEAARDLAKRGGRVLMACRNIEKCAAARKEIIDETYNRNVHCRELDLASRKSIHAFADKVKDEEKRVDILINNAGVMACPKSHTKDGFEMQLGVNYLGHFLLTNLLLDKLKESAPSRIINVGLFPHRKAKIDFKDLNGANDYDPKGAYLQSKLALMIFSKELHDRLKGTAVSTYCVYPGLARTELDRHLALSQSKVSSWLQAPIWWLMFTTPRAAVQTVLRCAVDPALAADSGKYYMQQQETEWPANAVDEAVNKRLWAISEHWTRLDEKLHAK